MPALPPAKIPAPGLKPADCRVFIRAWANQLPEKGKRAVSFGFVIC
jgi:hypothetical protein